MSIKKQLPISSDIPSLQEISSDCRQSFRIGALYIRVSTHEQDELSPDAQIRLGLDFAKSNKIIIPKEFIFVESVSGRKASKRREFQRMISIAKSPDHPIDVIIVWKFSRFARNQEESIVYKSMLKKDNIDVLSVSEPLVDGPFGSLIERIIEWMDEYYSIRLSGEVTRGMTEKALRGGYQARPPLGYKIVERGKPPVIVPEEAKIVKLIFKMYTEDRKSFFDIAKTLNSYGYKTSHNKDFEVRSIDYIIRNPTYCGMIRWNRTNNETNEIKDESEWIIADGHHPAIISKETFDKAQNIFKSSYRPKGARPSSSYKHWLSGLVKCPHCGRTMTAQTVYRKPGGEPYSYFVCYGYSKGKCSGKGRFSSLVLEPIVIQALKESLESEDITFSIIQKRPPEELDKTALIKSQLTQLAQKEKRIKDAYRDGIDTLEEYKDNKMILQKERDLLEKELEAQTYTTPAADGKEKMLEKIHNGYDIICSDNFTNQQKNEALRNIVEKIVYDRVNDELNLYFYLVETP